MPGYKQSLNPEELAKTGKCKWRLFVNNKYRADGKQNRQTKTIGPCSESQADKYLQELYLVFSKKAPQNANRITFSEFADIWLSRHSLTLSPNTHDGYTTSINSRLRPHFGNVRLNKISAEMVLEYINSLQTNGERLDGHPGSITSGTIFGLFKTLRAMLNKAKEWKYITHNPIDDIPRDKRPKPHYRIKPILEESQLSFLMQKLYSLNENGTFVKNQLFFYIALITGARSGEIIALSWSDIDFENKMISISKDIYTKDGKTMVQNRTKGMESRTVYCDDFCIELFKKHLHYQTEWLKARNIENPKQYIFIKRSKKTGRMKEAELIERQSFYRFMNRFLQKNGLPHMDVHGFRRTAASYSETNQVPLTAIQTMLGHKSLSTTMIYLRTLEKSRKEGVAALSNTYQQFMGKDKKDNKED